MQTAIKEWLAPPVFEDRELTRKARLLNTILKSFLVIILVTTPPLVLLNPAELQLSTLISLGGSGLVFFGLWLLLKRGYVQVSYYLTLLTTLLILAGNAYVFRLTSTSNATFVIVITLAALLAGGWAGITMAAISSIIVLVISWLLFGISFGPTQFELISFSTIYFIIAILLRLAVNSTEDALKIANVNEQALGESNRELQVIRTRLEERITERTRDLGISVEVSRRLSTILDPQQLVTEVVEQVRSTFNFYHVHIYLYDEKQENLLLVGGTGEAGQVMLTTGHKLPRGRGLVGRAAETNSVVLVKDVSEDETWLPNPLLPETKAEMAVPITIGRRVLGVLDIQHNVADGLQENEVTLLQSLANQVAVALQNATLYTQTQQQVEREALLNNISQRIQQAHSVDHVLQIAAEELGRALGASRATIQLANPVRSSNGRSQEPA